MSPARTYASPKTSLSHSPRHAKLISQLIRAGHTIIPLEPKSLDSLIKWEQYKNRRPKETTMYKWFIAQPDAAIGLVTNPQGNVAALYCKTGPFPEDKEWCKVDKGRLFWYPCNEELPHGQDYAPNISVPWIISVSEVPKVNNTTFPTPEELKKMIAESGKRGHDKQTKKDTAPPAKNNRPDWWLFIKHCAFMNEYHRLKFTPMWDKKWLLARHYASNMQHSNLGSSAPAASLGIPPDREKAIYKEVSAPSTCTKIVASGFNCKYYDHQKHTCMKSKNAHTPFGMISEKQFEESTQKTQQQQQLSHQPQH